MTNQILRVPSTVDIDRLYNEKPSSLRCKRDHITYFLSLVFSIPAHNRSALSRNGFTRISTTLLQKKIKYYRGLRDYLVEKGIIEVATGYSTTAGKCSGVRFTEAHRDSPLAAYPITDGVFNRALNKVDNFDKRLEPQHAEGGYNPYYHYYNPEWDRTTQYSTLMRLKFDFLRRHLEKVTIEREQALEQLSKVESIEREEHNRMGLNGPRLAKVKRVQREFIVEEISSNTWRATVDGTAGRFHTPITGLFKGLRCYLRYDSRELDSLDIKSSQPYLAQAFIDEDTMICKCVLDMVAIYNPALQPLYKFTDDRSRRDLRGEVINFLRENRDREDLIHYREMVNTGDLYRVFGEKLVELGIIHDCTPAKVREVGKKNLIKILFSTMRTMNGKIGRAFQALFPTFHRLLVLLKTGDKYAYKAVACALQHLEAKLVLEGVCCQLQEQNPTVPLLTIHDSIATTPENVDTVRQKMMAVLGDFIGQPPQITTESWGQETNLSEEQLSLKVSEWAAEEETILDDPEVEAD